MALWLVQGDVRLDAIVVKAWPEVQDLSTVTTRAELDRLLRKVLPGATPDDRALLAWQVWAFRARMEQGDVAVVPLRGGEAFALARVLGPYAFRQSGHVRPVEWLARKVPREAFDRDALHFFDLPYVTARVGGEADAACTVFLARMAGRTTDSVLHEGDNQRPTRSR